MLISSYCVVLFECMVFCLWGFDIRYSCFFFFKQKTAYEMRISDWSSDVCSSDLPEVRDRYIHRAMNARRIAGRPGSALRHENHPLPDRGDSAMEIGRASCRERVCQYV